MIMASPSEQRTMGSVLDDSAPIEHQNLVGMRDGGQSVSDHEHRSPLEQPVDGSLHQTLGLRVERGRRLVEYQNRRIDEQRTRDRQTLPLPAGESRAALPKHGVIAVR